MIIDEGRIEEKEESGVSRALVVVSALRYWCDAFSSLPSVLSKKMGGGTDAILRGVVVSPHSRKPRHISNTTMTNDRDNDAQRPGFPVVA
jgi:hypothetical protein